jgi:hypothetical protein
LLRSWWFGKYSLFLQSILEDDEENLVFLVGLPSDGGFCAGAGEEGA